MDFQAFVILLVVKSRAPWMCMACCEGREREVLQATVGSHQPPSALGSTPGAGRACAGNECLLCT